MLPPAAAGREPARASQPTRGVRANGVHARPLAAPQQRGRAVSRDTKTFTAPRARKQSCRARSEPPAASSCWPPASRRSAEQGRGLDTGKVRPQQQLVQSRCACWPPAARGFAEGADASGGGKAARGRQAHVRHQAIYAVAAASLGWDTAPHLHGARVLGHGRGARVLGQPLQALRARILKRQLPEVDARLVGHGLQQRDGAQYVSSRPAALACCTCSPRCSCRPLPHYTASCPCPLQTLERGAAALACSPRFSIVFIALVLIRSLTHLQPRAVCVMQAQAPAGLPAAPGGFGPLGRRQRRRVGRLLAGDLPCRCCAYVPSEPAPPRSCCSWRPQGQCCGSPV